LIGGAQPDKDQQARWSTSRRLSRRRDVQLAGAGKTAGENPLKPSSHARQCFALWKSLTSAGFAGCKIWRAQINRAAHSPQGPADRTSTNSFNELTLRPAGQFQETICAYGEISSL
jgi:hypothetical protein